MRRGRRSLLVAGAAVLAASLLGKAVNHPESAARSAPDDRAQDFLLAHGWVLHAKGDLVPDGASPVLQFQVPGCFGPVHVGLLPPTGEMASLFSQSTGPDRRVFYVFRGRISSSLPRFGYLHAKLDRVMTALGFRPRAGSSVLAVSQPQRCRLEAAVPWSEL